MASHEKLSKTFGGLKGSLAAGALLATSALPFAASAEQPTCAPLYQTSTGREVNAGLSAHMYSQERPGNVGISIFPGADLGAYSPEQIGAYLVKQIKDYGRNLDAKCFVHNDSNREGTAINYKINGLSWSPDHPLNVTQAMDDDTIGSVIGTALAISVTAKAQSSDQGSLALNQPN